MSGAVDEFERDPWEGEMDEYGNEELRISADDGMAYTKLEFIAYFGGTSEWDESEIVSQDLVMPEEEAAVITAEHEDAAVAADANSILEKTDIEQQVVEIASDTIAVPTPESIREEKMAEKAKTMAALAKVEDNIEKRKALARAEQAKVEKEQAEEIARQEAVARKKMEDVRLAESKARKQRLEDKAIRAEARAAKAKAEADKVKQQAIDKRAKVEAKIRAREEKANRAAAKAKKAADERRAKAKEAAVRLEEVERQADIVVESTENDNVEVTLEEQQMEALIMSTSISEGSSGNDNVGDRDASTKGDDSSASIERGDKSNAGTAIRQGKISEKQDKTESLEIMEEATPESEHRLLSKSATAGHEADELKIASHNSAHDSVTNSILTYESGRGAEGGRTLLTPAQSPEIVLYNTNEQLGSFLSPRGATSNQKPQLNSYTALDLGLSDVDGDGIISARDISRTIQIARASAVQEANQDLAERIQMVQSYYNHERFEESYRHLMQKQREFSETLMWDRDPEKRHMPISPRLTNFPKVLSPDRDRRFRSSVLREKRITFGPSKPTSSMSSSSRNTPRKRHVVARGSGAYTATAKDLKGNTAGSKKRKALSAKRMLKHYMQSVEHVPLSVSQVSSTGFSVIKESRRVGKPGR